MTLTFQSKNSTSPTAGFTLLEVLISLAVMVFISFAIFQATTETYKLRDSLAAEADFNNAIRLSMNIIERDISLIYSPMAFVQSKTNTSNNSGNSGNSGNPANQPPGAGNLGASANIGTAVLPDDLGRSFTYWSPALDISGLRPSHFVGTEDQLSFISLSHHRIYKNSPESEFAKISYQTKPDTENKDTPDTLILIKTESPNAFASDDIKDTFTHSYELLHGVKKISYSYYQRDGNTWKTFKSWDSDRSETKNLIPEIVELKIQVQGPRKLSFEGIYKFRPEIPFNGLNHST
jgi:prepilin-type N-terminal cleavage/methylation domain-containing protein